MKNFSPSPYIPAVSFFLGCILICFGQTLGLAPLVLGMCSLALESSYTRVKSDHSLALEALQKRMEVYESQLISVTKAHTQTQLDLVSLRNATRPVGGWVK